jgi:NosR/NirI family transcriptional regulator, nitrous oxide reductase regulator
VKRVVLSFAFLLIAVVVNGQAPSQSLLQQQVKWLFPDATGFSSKGWDPPHVKVYKGDPARPESLRGLVFWTRDLQPNERGYDGPIEILVGMDTKGTLSGIIVLRHHEPYGSFSVDTPSFANQFEAKSVRDPFRVGSDIDAVSRATLSVTSATRAVRNSARRMAATFLSPPGTR